MLESVAEKIDTDDGDCLWSLFSRYREPLTVLISQVTAKAHDIGGEFGLLNFDDDVFFRATRGFDPGGKIQPVDGEGAILQRYGGFLGRKIQGEDFLLDDGGKYQDGDLVVL